MQSSVIPYVAVAKDQSVAETAVISHASLLHSSSLQCGPALHFLQVKCSGPVKAGRSRLGVAVGGEAKEYCRWRSCAQCMIWCIQGGAVHNRVASGAAPRQNRGSSSDCIPATPCIVLSTTTRRETKLKKTQNLSTTLKCAQKFVRFILVHIGLKTQLQQVLFRQNRSFCWNWVKVSGVSVC